MRDRGWLRRGAILPAEAFSIALVLPGARVLATDVAASAIHVARGGVVRRSQLKSCRPLTESSLARIIHEAREIRRGWSGKAIGL